MTKDNETVDKKPMSLVDARKKMSEHKPASRIQGNKHGQAVSREGRESGDRKGKR